MERKIVWLKWVDPLAHLVHDEKPRPQDEDEDEIGFREAQESFIGPGEPHYHPNASRKGQIGPSVVGPMGIVPIHENNLPSKLYNFWMGHANFGITNDIEKKISLAPGVESVDVFTRYRFRIAVGYAFDQDEVKKGVEQAVCPAPPKVQVTKEAVGSGALKQLCDYLKVRYPFWAVFVSEGGTMNWACGESKEEVEEKSTVFKQGAKHIVVSW